VTDYCSNCLSGVNRSQEHSWRRNLVLFLVDSCIPARQRTDICNTRCFILLRFSHFHVSHFPPLQSGAENSCLAFFTLAFWCRIFMSRNFMSRIFSVPIATTCVKVSPFETTQWVKKTRHLTLAHTFTKYWPIFKILSLLDSVVGNL